MRRRKFAISDLHFGHAKIIELAHRPFSNVEEMNEQMVLRWNSVVGDNDEVFFGGDFMFTKKDEWFNRLNGIKHLIKGNHDHKAVLALDWYSVHERLELEHFVTLDEAEPDVPYMFVLDHYPIEDWNKRFRDSVHLYGHVHNVPVMELRHRFSMCAEHLNYTPRDLDVFVKMAEAQP
jgi:calcineurin-like phosphoesterase family protein